MDGSRLENFLHKASLFIGLFLLVGSIYLSYDGFDQTVSGSNPEYGVLAMALGITLAVTFNLLEFIVSSRPENLNTTLKFMGILAYGYSIYTNFLGLQNLLHMDTVMAALVAVGMDVVPEPMIAWGLGEAVMHDLFKNLGGFMTSPVNGSKSGGNRGGDHSSHSSGPSPEMRSRMGMGDGRPMPPMGGEGEGRMEPRPAPQPSQYRNNGASHSEGKGTPINLGKR